MIWFWLAMSWLTAMTIFFATPKAIDRDLQMSRPNSYLLMAAAKMAATIDTMIEYAVVDGYGGNCQNRVEMIFSHRKDIERMALWSQLRHSGNSPAAIERMFLKSLKKRHRHPSGVAVP